jgi:integrase/recombinase XerD
MLYDKLGARKYLTARERAAFLAAARQCGPQIETFCYTLAFTGARISEVLAVVPSRIDTASAAIIIECLKRRSTGVFRAVPIPGELIARLERVHNISSMLSDNSRRDKRLWQWGRTTAWQRVKEVMATAKIDGRWAMPKALRHAFAVHGTVEAGVPLNIMQRWMGHARIETTAIYANAIGKEERALAARMWRYTVEAKTL